MKKYILVFTLLSANCAFAWHVASAHCVNRNFPDNQDVVTYTSVYLEAGPEARATLSQRTKLENNPPNVGLGMTEFEKSGFYSSKTKINENNSIIDRLLGNNSYDGFRLEGGTIFSLKGMVRESKVDITFTKRYSDGEAHTSKVEIFTRANPNENWVIQEVLPECHLAVYH